MASPTSPWDPVTSDAYSKPTSTDFDSASSSASASASYSSPPVSSSSTDAGNFWHLYQNYFAFVAVAIGVFLIGGCLVYRRKKRTAIRLRAARQVALSRDVENQGVANPRAQPLGVRGTIALAHWRRRREEEGLNEAGEAPPAYKSAPDDDHVVLEGGQPTPHTNATHPPLAVPLPTIGREHTGLKPPDYTATVVAPVGPERASTSANVLTNTTHPNSAADRDVELGNLPAYHDNDTHERR
jgi:hypothetical protein